MPETKERQIPEGKIAINPVVIDDSYRSKKPEVNCLPETISTEKLITYLKSARVDTKDMPDMMYMYSTGRNAALDLLLVSIYTGEFD